MGEPAGIGAEIAAGAWSALRATGPVFFLIDDASRAFTVPVQAIAAPEEAAAVFPHALPVLHRPLPHAPVAGQARRRQCRRRHRRHHRGGGPAPRPAAPRAW